MHTFNKQTAVVRSCHLARPRHRVWPTLQPREPGFVASPRSFAHAPISLSSTLEVEFSFGMKNNALKRRGVALLATQPGSPPYPPKHTEAQEREPVFGVRSRPCSRRGVPTPLSVLRIRPDSAARRSHGSLSGAAFVEAKKRALGLDSPAGTRFPTEGVEAEAKGSDSHLPPRAGNGVRTLSQSPAPDQVRWSGCAACATSRTTRRYSTSCLGRAVQCQPGSDMYPSGSV